MLSLILNIPSKIIGDELDRKFDRMLGKRLLDSKIKKTVKKLSKNPSLPFEDRERFKEINLKKFYLNVLQVKRKDILPFLSQMNVEGVMDRFTKNGFSKTSGKLFFESLRVKMAQLALWNPYIFKNFVIHTQNKGIELNGEIMSLLENATDIIKKDLNDTMRKLDTLQKDNEEIIMGIAEIKTILKRFVKDESIPEKVEEKIIPPKASENVRKVKKIIGRIPMEPNLDKKMLSVVYNKLGTYEYSKGKLGKAINFFGLSLEMEPQNRVGWYNKEKCDLVLRRRIKNEIERAKKHLKNVTTYLYEDYEDSSDLAQKDNIMKDIHKLEKLERKVNNFQESIELSSGGNSKKNFAGKERTEKRKKIFKFDLELISHISKLTTAVNIFEEQYIKGTEMNITTEYRTINKHLTELENAYLNRQTLIREG